MSDNDNQIKIVQEFIDFMEQEDDVELHLLDVLDNMATLGIKFVRVEGENPASLAYMTALVGDSLLNTGDDGDGESTRNAVDEALGGPK